MLVFTKANLAKIPNFADRSYCTVLSSCWKRTHFILCINCWSFLMTRGYFATHEVIISCFLILILLTWRIWWAPNNASKWQMGFNSAFQKLNVFLFSMSVIKTS